MLTYQVNLKDASHHLARITLWVPVDGQSLTEIVFPVWTPGSYMLREYTRNIESIRAVFCETQKTSDTAGEQTSESISPITAQSTLLFQPVELGREGKNRWIIRHANAGVLQIDYVLYCRENTVRTNWLDVDYGFLTGAATFPWVEGRQDDAIRIELQLPDRWDNTACSLQLLEHSEAKVVYQASNFDELVDSPMVFGNFNTRTFEVGGRNHAIVHVGAENLWDQEKAANDLKTIVSEQHRFWKEIPYQSYWFLNLCCEAGGGLEHDNSTVLMCSRWAMRSRTSYVDWLSLVSHEFFHTWNVRRLRPKTLRYYDYESEQFFKELWIAEGITSYFDDLILARCGLCSTEEFLTRLSSTIQAVQNSPGRLVQDLANSSWDTWVKHYRPDENSPNSRMSYYLKGSLLAWLLDAKLRQHSVNQVSLDDVMRQLWQDYRETGYTHGDFAEIVEHLSSTEIRQWLDEQLESTEEIDFSPALKQFGLIFKPISSEDVAKKASKFWIGCETAFIDGRIVVRNLYRGSSADRAGINVDDELIALSGYRLTSETWPKRLEDWPLGTKLKMLVARRGKIRRLEIRMESKPTHNWELGIDSSANPSNLSAWLTR
ncbi:MAG: hypothetical protein U0930_02655 [Pirellulales bacterium]